MTTVDEVSSDKTKVLDELIFRSVSLDCIVLLPNSMSKLIHNRCKLTCKLLIKAKRLHTCMQTNNWVHVFMLWFVILCCSALKLY